MPYRYPELASSRFTARQFDPTNLLDRYPRNPTPWNDEFSESALAAKWTSPVSSAAGLETTVTLANGRLTFEPTTAGSASTGLRGGWGIRQPAPTGSFTLTACVYDVTSNDNGRAGIFVARDGARGILVGRLFSDSTPLTTRSFTYSRTALWTTDATVNSGIAIVRAREAMQWCRLDFDSSDNTVDTYGSLDGITWTAMSSNVALGGAPDDIGLGLYSDATDVLANHVVNVYWFRVDRT